VRDAGETAALYRRRATRGRSDGSSEIPRVLGSEEGERGSDRARVRRGREVRVYVRKTLGVPVDQAPADAARAFASELIESGDNTYDNYLALARFGRFVGNQAVFAAMLEILDGHEALRNLYRRARR
jgi:hypothetical protein